MPMDISWVPKGYDPSTAFLIDVKIDGFRTKDDDGRKKYVKGKSLKWVVDADKFSICEIMSDLKEEISWQSYQVPNIQYFDKNESKQVELLSESQIPLTFEMYENERRIELKVVICDIERSSKCSGNNPQLCTPTQPSPPIVIGSQSQVGSTQEMCVASRDVEFEKTGDAEIEPSRDAEFQLSMDAEFEPNLTIAAEDSSHTIYNDDENPIIALNSVFPDVVTFRKALRYFAIKNHFEFVIVKTDKTRFIGKCKVDNCPWRIRASVLRDNKTFMVTVLPYEHTCASINLLEGKMVNKSWVSDRAGDWLRENPSAGAKAVQDKLQFDYKVKISYSTAWKGRKTALDQIHGTWEDSFQLIYNFKAEIEKRCPGSIVEIDCVRDGKKAYFSKIFVALKACIDGFLRGCRPYIAIDSTHLTGKYRGQLAVANGIDGENSLFPVAYAIFESETTQNWKWFATHLRNAIGKPPGLAISSDAGKGLAAAISVVFPDCEHRECMRHLMENFKKRFHGVLYDDHMWPAAKAYIVEECEAHLQIIKDKTPQPFTFGFD